MSYFSKKYIEIKLPKKKGNGAIGLRNAQIGAIHAIGQHFSLYETEPSLVVMPTGSGKTAVLTLCPFLLEAERVLILSSSKLVRGQIVDDLKELKTLIKIGVFKKSIKLPKCKELNKHISSISDWKELEKYDYVVGIPKSITAGFSEKLTPRKDLFDLIIVDECHHLPASTWTTIIEYFSNSKKVYFTATPFRRDDKEIKGKLIYSYPLSKAYKDKIFGSVGYYSIKVGEKTKIEKDILIAKKTENVFRKDREQGLDHFIMVRTKHKNHANDLKKIYEQNTNLNLKVIHSDHTYSHIKKTIQSLRRKELDGIICVNMLAEGFDFPSLKIAAIHEHHKSLAVTLQFIGRFARTNAPNLGSAKFIAAESDIVLGQQHLMYQDGAIWSDIIINLSENAIEELKEVQEFNENFNDLLETKNPDKLNISLGVLKPYSHIKIFRTNEFDINGVIDIGNQKIIFHQTDEVNNTVIFITEEAIKPKWIAVDDIKNTHYYMYILYHHKKTNMLYVHYSGKKTNLLYEDILECFNVKEYNNVPKSDIHKALYGLKDLTFFNIGLQSRAIQSGESYRIISGSAAHNRITNSEGRMYSNGHIQGSGIDVNGNEITIGYSSGAKIWGSNYINIKDFINFCNLIGTKINSTVTVRTNTGIDNIPIPQIINKIPNDVKPSFAFWHTDIYIENPNALFSIDGQEVYRGELVNLDLVIDYNYTSRTEISFIIKNENFEIPILYSFKEGYKYNIDNELTLFINNGDDNFIELLKYLRNCPVSFQLSDLSTITNFNELLVRGNKSLYDVERLKAIDWDYFRTDISKEFKNPKKGKRHIHDVLFEIIKEASPSIIVYDHGTGELADFIVIKDNIASVNVELYHVKASDTDQTGDRVSYLYEVCGQAEKSLIWTKSISTLKVKIIDRLKNNDDSVKLLGTNDKIKHGDYKELKRILSLDKTFKYKIVIVQPGLLKDNLTEKLSHLLASTDDYVRSNANNEELMVWCS